MSETRIMYSTRAVLSYVGKKNTPCGQMGKQHFADHTIGIFALKVSQLILMFSDLFFCLYSLRFPLFFSQKTLIFAL